VQSSAFILSLVVATSVVGPARANADTKVALVPGGPHPYFSAWEQAGADAIKDFGLTAANHRVPQKWELSQQNQLLESLLSQGYCGQFLAATRHVRRTQEFFYLFAEA
jgi:ribose transport system substrate-binding protein